MDTIAPVSVMLEGSICPRTRGIGVIPAYQYACAIASRLMSVPPGLWTRVPTAGRRAPRWSGHADALLPVSELPLLLVLPNAASGATGGRCHTGHTGAVRNANHSQGGVWGPG